MTLSINIITFRNKNNDILLTLRISMSPNSLDFNHFLRKCLFTPGSAWNIARGIALKNIQNRDSSEKYIK
jgi:hypothetical protein